jgi:hypothetical protein
MSSRSTRHCHRDQQQTGKHACKELPRDPVPQRLERHRIAPQRERPEVDRARGRRDEHQHQHHTPERRSTSRVVRLSATNEACQSGDEQQQRQWQSLRGVHPRQTGNDPHLVDLSAPVRAHLVQRHSRPDGGSGESAGRAPDQAPPAGDRVHHSIMSGAGGLQKLQRPSDWGHLVSTPTTASCAAPRLEAVRRRCRSDPGSHQPGYGFPLWTTRFSDFRRRKVSVVASRFLV